MELRSEKAKTNHLEKTIEEKDKVIKELIKENDNLGKGVEVAKPELNWKELIYKIRDRYVLGGDQATYWTMIQHRFQTGRLTIEDRIALRKEYEKENGLMNSDTAR
jgi:hypothetical protein